jgi:predicted hydrocarbon binding protein
VSVAHRSVATFSRKCLTSWLQRVYLAGKRRKIGLPKNLTGSNDEPETESQVRVTDVISFDETKELLWDNVFNLRIMAIDTNFYKGLRDQLYKVFQTGASLILYEMGLGYGKLAADVIMRGKQSRIGMYRDFMSRGKFQGMGVFQVPFSSLLQFPLGGGITVKLKNSFFSQAVGKTGQLECFVFAGTIAGAATQLFGKKYSCNETKCASMSADYTECEFHLKPE